MHKRAWLPRPIRQHGQNDVSRSPDIQLRELQGFVQAQRLGPLATAIADPMLPGAMDVDEPISAADPSRMPLQELNGSVNGVASCATPLHAI